MKKWFKKFREIFKYVLIGLIIVCIIIAMILLLNTAFKHEASISLLEAAWSADAALSFLGTIIAACIAIFGVFLTVWYNRKQYEDEARSKICPHMYLSAKDLRVTGANGQTNDLMCILNPINEYNGLKNTDTEQFLLPLYFVIQPDSIQLKSKLSDTQMEYLQFGGHIDVHDGNNCRREDKHIVALQLEIKNVGVGAALFFQIGLGKSDMPNSKSVFSPISTFLVNQTFYSVIYSDAPLGEIVGKYYLELCYEDIAQNKYSQKYLVTIEPDSKNKCSPALSIEFIEKKLEDKEKKKHKKGVLPWTN